MARTIAERGSRPDDDICPALAAEADRGAVLVGYAFLEFALERLLRRFCEHRMRKCPAVFTKQLNKAFGGSEELPGLFGSGWAKIHSAALLGLIDSHTFHFLEGLRKFRNNCAHFSGELHLTVEPINEIVSHLRPECISKVNSITQEGHSQVMFGPKQLAGDFEEPRLKLMMACLVVYHYIIKRSHKYDPATRGKIMGVGLGGFQFSKESLLEAGILTPEEMPLDDSPG